MIPKHPLYLSSVSPIGENILYPPRKNDRNTTLTTLLATVAIVGVVSIGILLCVKPDIIQGSELAARITGICLLSLTTGGFAIFFLFAPSSFSLLKDKTRKEQLLEFAKLFPESPDTLTRIQNLNPEDLQTVYQQCLVLHQQGFIPSQFNRGVFTLEWYGTCTLINIDNLQADHLKLTPLDMLSIIAGLCLTHKHYHAVALSNNHGIFLISNLHPIPNPNNILLDVQSPKLIPAAIGLRHFVWINASNIDHS